MRCPTVAVSVSNSFPGSPEAAEILALRLAEAPSVCRGPGAVAEEEAAASGEGAEAVLKEAAVRPERERPPPSIQ